jgi:hypothetical protein
MMNRLSVVGCQLSAKGGGLAFASRLGPEAKDSSGLVRPQGSRKYLPRTPAPRRDRSYSGRKPSGVFRVRGFFMDTKR